MIRLIVLVAAAGLLAGEAFAAPPADPVPAPTAHPALKHEKAKAATHKPAAPSTAAHHAPAAASVPATHVHAKAGPKAVSKPATQAGTSAAIAVPVRAPVAKQPAARAAPAFAMAASATTSPMDLGAVKQAIELAHKGRADEATSTEGTISDPLARKLVEWVILRGEDTSTDFSRYAAFIAANPSWPSIVTLRRHAEVALWQQQAEPQAVIAFFRTELPRTAKGWFALARALLAVGDQARAQQAVRTAWRDDAFSADLEAQARQAFGGLITPDDDKARMDVRLYAEDGDAGMSAARHLDEVNVDIAKARAAVTSKSANAKALLDAVPAEGRRDPGYIFSRVQLLRRSDKVAEAGQLLAAAPRDAAVLGDPDQWWVERRLVARKLLDLGDSKLAYQVAAGAAPATTENHRAEQQFTAGWIALRFLHDPATALTHFAAIAEGVSNPITLARSFYWQGRAAEAMNRGQDAHGHYEAAANYPTAYYGQLARARLGLDQVALRVLPEPPAELRGLEVARAFEILYAVDARDLVAAMAADLGDKATDASTLVTLAEIAKHHDDARSTLLIGKPALSRGLPLERYAFPDFGVPSYRQIGPAVERCVVFSIVRQESAFNPRVVSSANAIGLMQVTPAAGRNTAQKYKVAFDQGRLMSDVEYNAQLGTAELGDNIASYRGSYILAFAAYNAGPRRAKEWIEQFGDPRNPKVDPVDWIERIPFSETRNYVQRVIENMQVYRARFESNSKLLIEADLRRGG